MSRGDKILCYHFEGCNYVHFNRIKIKTSTRLHYIITNPTYRNTHAFRNNTNIPQYIPPYFSSINPMKIIHFTNLRTRNTSYNTQHFLILSPKTVIEVGVYQQQCVRRRAAEKNAGFVPFDKPRSLHE